MYRAMIFYSLEKSHNDHFFGQATPIKTVASQAQFKNLTKWEKKQVFAKHRRHLKGHAVGMTAFKIPTAFLAQQ